MTATILTEPAATALWRDLVREAQQRGRAPLDDELESYLVFLLMRHLRDARLGERVFAIDYLSALEDRGALQREELRDVGDRCLLIAGLYPQQAQRRLVSMRYFLDLGSRAYGDLADAARAAAAQLYRHLAAAFARMVRVLVEVRRLSGGSDAIDPLSRHVLCLADPAGIAHEFPGAIVLGAGNDHLQ